MYDFLAFISSLYRGKGLLSNVGNRASSASDTICYPSLLHLDTTLVALSPSSLPLPLVGLLHIVATHCHSYIANPFCYPTLLTPVATLC